MRSIRFPLFPVLRIVFMGNPTMAKIEKKWIVQVWDDKNSRHEYLVVFGTKMTPLLSQARAKARATSWDIAQRGAQMVKQKTGKLARVILK